MTPNYYNTIEKESFAEFKDRSSRFLAYAFPIYTVDDFKKRLKDLKEGHPKAAHYCFAYRLGIDGSNFRSVDDGEPPGTAGKPILGQIDSKGLTNLAVIVVRYFGGSLLGVPGLINAYKTASSLVLQTTPVVQKAIEINYFLKFDYTRMNGVMRIIKKFHCSIHKQDIQLFCEMEIGVPKANHELCIIRLKDLAGVELEKIII
jgi:uncharacterized YigZ family protein